MNTEFLKKVYLTFCAGISALSIFALCVNADTQERVPEEIILNVPETVEVPSCVIIETTREATGPAAETEAAEIDICETEPTVEVNLDDLYVLAHVICGEAQSCSRELQIAVGSVVLNRVAHPSYPDTVEGVVFQKRQYACTWDGNYYRTPTSTNWEVAEYLLREGSQLPDDVVFQAQFKQGSYVYAKIENEYFCGLK